MSQRNNRPFRPIAPKAHNSASTNVQRVGSDVTQRLFEMPGRFTTLYSAMQSIWRPTEILPLCRTVRHFTAAMLAGAALVLPSAAPAQVSEIESVIVEEGRDASVTRPDVVVDQAGNRYVVGSFDGVVEFGEGRDVQVLDGTNGDLFVAKYDADGNLQWVQEFETDFGGGGVPSAAPAGIDLDSSENEVENDLYVAGVFVNTLQVGDQTLRSIDSNADSFIAKLDPETGEVRWVNQVSGTRPILVNAMSASGGNVFITGRFQGISQFRGVFGESDSLLSLTPGGNDMFVARYDFSGGFSYAIQAGGDGAEGTDIEATDLRTIVVVGNFFETARFPDRTGQPVEELTSAGSRDGFVARYGFGGDLRDLLPIGGTGSDSALRVVTSGRGFDNYVAGTFNDVMTIGSSTFRSRGANDTYLLRLGTFSDVVERAIHIGGDNVDFPGGLALDADDNPYLAGGFSSSELAIGEGTGAIRLPKTDTTTNYIASFNRELVPSSAQTIQGNLRVEGVAANGSADLAEFHVAASYRSEVAFGDGDQAIVLPPPAGSSAMAIARFVAEGGDEQSDALYVSTSTNGNLDGLRFRDEDVLLFSRARQQFALLIDGSDIGLGGTDIGAVHQLADGSFLLSLNTPVSLPGVGDVDDSDIVRFVPTSLGEQTSGSFEVFQRGTQVGLTTDAEDVDAVSLDAEGRLVVSTAGRARVPGNTGDLVVRDEDLIVLNSGRWELLVQGSGIGLNDGAEHIKAATADSGGVAFSTLGAFSAGELTGGGEDVVECRLLDGDGAQVSDCVILLDGSEVGLSGLSIDAFSVAVPDTEETSVLGQFLANQGEASQ